MVILLLLTSDQEALVRAKGCVNLVFISILWGLVARKFEASSCGEEEYDWWRRAIGSVKAYTTLIQKTDRWSSDSEGLK